MFVIYTWSVTCISGVPKLKRSELEAACEDFSNVIGSSTVGTVYKGTLSNGIEISVVSVPVKSVKVWSKNLETQFRKKVLYWENFHLDTLARCVLNDSSNYFEFYGSRLTHYQKWTTKILSTLSDIARKTSLLLGSWFLNMLQTEHSLNIYIVST